MSNQSRLAKLGAVIVGGFMIFLASGANATLIADTISIQGGATTQGGVVVADPGSEYDEEIGFLNEIVNVSGSSFTFTQPA